LDGRKTYITAFVLAALNLAVAFNLITPDHLAQINTVLGAFGLAALRAGVSKT
jgi:heme/copper-type cytochrome/quinol oxidase subunit 4